MVQIVLLALIGRAQKFKRARENLECFVGTIRLILKEAKKMTDSSGKNIGLITTNGKFENRKQ